MSTDEPGEVLLVEDDPTDLELALHTRILPVVAVTSSREECDIIESYRLGANSYIVKPIDFDQFTCAVQQLGLYWLSLNQPLSS